MGRVYPENRFKNAKSLKVYAINNGINKEATLACYDPTKEVTVQFDALLTGLGAALLQDKKPIALASKTLMDTEPRYTEQELLAVVYVCEHFHTYLYGRSFIAESENKRLEAIQLKNLISAAPRLQRMFLLLQAYDATVKYRPCKQVLVADALSRLSPEEELPIPYVQIQSTRPWHTVGTELRYFIFIFLLTY